MIQLEALNMLLRLVGSSPVSNLDSEHPDAVNALATLKRIREKAQKRGWWFNIDYNRIYSPDESSGEIKIEKEVTTLVSADGYVVRNDKLYDKLNQTYKFEADVCIFREVRILNWDEMPNSMQEHCAYYAGAEFVRDELEDDSKKGDLMRDATFAMMELKKEDLEQGNYNKFQAARVIQARGGVRPYNRGASTRFYGTPDA